MASSSARCSAVRSGFAVGFMASLRRLGNVVGGDGSVGDGGRQFVVIPPCYHGRGGGPIPPPRRRGPSLGTAATFYWMLLKPLPRRRNTPGTPDAPPAPDEPDAPAAQLCNVTPVSWRVALPPRVA